MSLRKLLAVVALGVTASSSLAQPAPHLGKAATSAEVAAWDISIAPDGAGLPAGRGGVKAGKEIFATRCAMCHGEKGEGGKGLADALAGGQGSMTTPTPVKSVGSYWPYATTLFDYVRRAMPYVAPMSLTNDETYSVVAYVLFLNGIISNENAMLDAKRLKAIEMPNRRAFIPSDEAARLLTPRAPPGSRVHAR